MKKTCKKCGGKTGYFYILSVEFEQWMSWDDEPIQAQDTGNGVEKKWSYCYDCGYRFKR